MKTAHIGKDKLRDFLRAAAKDHTVYAPVREGEDIVLSKLGPDTEPCLGYSNFTLSPKGLFFPQCETLCTYCDGEVSEVPAPNENVLVFGIRPCDAQAIHLLDKVFGEVGNQTDPYYMQRRANSVVISLACIKPCPTCFCTTVGGNPAGTDGSDVLAVELADSLLLEALTEKGEAFLAAAGSALGKAGADDRKAADRIKADAKQMMPPIDLKGLTETLKGNFKSPLWAKISKVCLGCGLCTYQCPTCHCFDITDEEKRGKGRRIRTWDSCQYALFTRHASGHNPRPSNTERMRQRVLHKFLYTVENLGAVFCVGCGRCVRNCPVNLDLRETLRQLHGEEAPG